MDRLQYSVGEGHGGRVRPVCAVMAITALAGCGSSWVERVPDGADPIVFDCENKLFYLDADGDGWGDPASEPQALCQADAGLGLTASNGRDCDDDPSSKGSEITGRIGAVCPADLAAPGTEDYGGVIFGDSEYVYVHGLDNPLSSFLQASRGCELWSGGALEEATGSERGALDNPRGALATFDAAQDLNELLGALDAVLGGAPFAGFVGVEWIGSDAYADPATSWAWVDDTPDNISTLFTFCGGNEPPVPFDFFPQLTPGDPDHEARVTDRLDELRLALVRRSDGWCLGTPADADTGSDTGPSAAPYTAAEAHFLCERPTPLPEDYAESALPGEAVDAEQ